MTFRLIEQKRTEAGKLESYPVLGVGPFKTQEEAEDAAKLQQPRHGGEIVALSAAAVRRDAEAAQGPRKRRPRDDRRRDRH